MSEQKTNSSREKQQQFAIEYLKDHDGTQAAIRAGYNRTGAAASGRRLLDNPRVQLRIKRLQEAEEQAEQQTLPPDLTQKEILDFLTLVLRGGKGKQTITLNQEEDVTEDAERLWERLHAVELLTHFFPTQPTGGGQ